MLAQLVYVSNRKSNCTNEEIEKILESCKSNNSPLDITGVLLYTDKKFIQLVEGDNKLINSLYDKIKTDTRHDNVRMVSLMPIKEKSFPSWHMGSKKIANDSVDFKTDISQVDKKVFDKILSGKEQDGQRALNLIKKFL